MIIRVVFSLALIFVILVFSLFMMPLDSILKRANLESITYTLAEGSLFEGRINGVTYDDQFELGNYEINGSPTLSGAKIAFTNADASVSGIFKANIFNGTYYLEDFKTSAPYKTNGLGVINLEITINEMVIKNNNCQSVKGELSLSNNSFDESVNGEIKCLDDGIYEAVFFNSKGEEMALLVYRPGFIDLEIETSILKSDVSIFLGDRMGFTIPL